MTVENEIPIDFGLIIRFDAQHPSERKVTRYNVYNGESNEVSLKRPSSINHIKSIHEFDKDSS